MTQTIICSVRQNIKTSWHTITVSREGISELNMELLDGPYLVLVDLAEGAPGFEVVMSRNIPLAENYVQRVPFTEDEWKWRISSETRLSLRFLSPKRARITVRITGGEA